MAESYTFMPSHKSEFEIHKDVTIQVTVEGNEGNYSLPVSDIKEDSKRVNFAHHHSGIGRCWRIANMYNIQSGQGGSRCRKRSKYTRRCSC